MVEFSEWVDGDGSPVILMRGWKRSWASPGGILHRRGQFKGAVGLFGVD